MENIEKKEEQVKEKKNELDIPFYKQPAKTPQQEEKKEDSSTLVEKIHEEAKYQIAKNDEKVQSSIIDVAKKNIDVELHTITNKVEKENNKASMERNEEACSIFGYSVKKGVVEIWQQKMMIWAYNFWFCIYYFIAFFTVAPICLVFGKIQESIKKTWLSILLALIIYFLFAVGIPVALSFIGK